MAATQRSVLPQILEQQSDGLLAQWLLEQQSATTLRSDLLPPAELEQQSREFLDLLGTAAASGSMDARGREWEAVREFLARLSRARAQHGFTPRETATFIFSLKQPLFRALQQQVPAEQLGTEMWESTLLLDDLGLYTVESYQRSREEVIHRQQQEILELSTPVVKLWEGVVAVPLIGTLDSARTQVVMENLLERIVETGASIAIIDITGVPTVDTLVAQHLIKTVAAARLMGADCVISGIRPQIAQTIVHLGINLEEVTTKASLADAIAVAFARLGLRMERV